MVGLVVLLIWIGTGRKTKVLPNDNGGFDQGVAGVVVESTAGNIFELLVANSFGLLGLFAHIRIWLVVVVGFGGQCS